MTTVLEQLTRRVEQVIQEHLYESQQAAADAVVRAFAATRAAQRARPVKQDATGRRRRAMAEIAELAEQLFEAVLACPGETMTVIAARVGQEPRALLRPMMQLKDSGRVRSAGERNFTRYFPMAAAKSA